MAKKFIWPGPYVIEHCNKPLGIIDRLKIAWQCLFREDVRGLCLEAPDWAKEKEK